MPIHVLMVDDDPELCEEVMGALECTGYKVSCVHRGEEAIQAISKEDFDIVLMDLKMPGMGGLEAFEGIKKIKPLLPIIMVTGALPSEVVEKFRKTDFAAVIYKPFDIEKLVEGIENLAGGEKKQ